MENWKISKQMDIALKLTWKHRPNFFQVSLDVWLWRRNSKERLKVALFNVSSYYSDLAFQTRTIFLKWASS